MQEAEAMRGFDTIRVRDRMRSSFIHALPTDSVLQVRQLMQLARIRHLPVLDADGRLAGIVSHRDVLEASASPAERLGLLERQERLRSVPVGRVMTVAVQSIGPEETLCSAAEQMLRHKIGCLLVVAPPANSGRVVGLITESDLLAAAYLPGFDARTLEPEPQPGSGLAQGEPEAEASAPQPAVKRAVELLQ